MAPARCTEPMELHRGFSSLVLSIVRELYFSFLVVRVDADLRRLRISLRGRCVSMDRDAAKPAATSSNQPREGAWKHRRCGHNRRRVARRTMREPRGTRP